MDLPSPSCTIWMTSQTASINSAIKSAAGLHNRESGIHEMSPQTVRRVHQNSPVLFIPLSKDKLNLIISLICHVLGCLLLSFVLSWLARLLRCVDCTCLLLFAEVDFPSHSKGWFPFILVCSQQKCSRTGPLGFSINYASMNWEQFMHSLKNYLHVINIGHVWFRHV